MTDTEIKTCYEKAVSTLQSVEGKDDEASKALAHDMRRELHNLRERWDAILAVKRDGYITDSARVNAVRKEVADSAKFAGLRIRVTIEPYKVEGLESPPFHHVVAHRIGPMAEADERRWVRWTEQVSNALKPFPFVLPAHFSRTRYLWELTPEQRAHAKREAEEVRALIAEWIDEWEEYDSFEDEEEDCDEAEFESASARWAVDTWVWNGRPLTSTRRGPTEAGFILPDGSRCAPITQAHQALAPDARRCVAPLNDQACSCR